MQNGVKLNGCQGFGEINYKWRIRRKIISTTRITQFFTFHKCLRSQAIDSDEGNNSRISYELLQTKDSEEFSMDRETGWIKAKASYAGKFGIQFVLNVIAKDRFGEEPYFNDTAEVKVILFERNFLIKCRRTKKRKLQQAIN